MPFRGLYHSQAKLDAAKVAGIDGVLADYLDAASLDRAMSGGKIYGLTGPEALTYAQIARTLSQELGKPVTYVEIPAEAYKQGLLQSGVPGFIAEGLVDLCRHLRAGGGAEVTPWVEN